MKIQYILLIVCVVSTLALPDRSGEEESQNERGRLHRVGLRNDNVSVNSNDESINNLISSPETTTENRRSWVRHEKRRHWLKHGVNGEEQLHRLPQTHGLEENHDTPILNGDSQITRKLYRHRRHQHHKNRTTTITPMGASLSGMELEKKQNSPMPFEFSEFETKLHNRRHHHHRNRTTATPPSSTSLSEQELEEKPDNVVLVENSQIERKHHRHHHRNRTTTTTPSSTSLAEENLEERQDNLMPTGNSQKERKHYRHHHRNRTTTTTTASTPLSDVEE